MSSLPLPAEYEGSICEIKTLDNALISTAVMGAINEGHIVMHSKKGKLPLVGYGQSVKVNIFNTRQGFMAIVGNVYTSSHKEMRLIEISNLTNQERRKFFRVDLDMLAKIQIISPESEERTFDVIIKDLSLSGMRFQSKVRLPVDTSCKVTLTAAECRMLTLDYQIVRIICEDDYHNIHYGCLLTTPEGDKTERLFSFLFKKQREQLNRNG